MDSRLRGCGDEVEPASSPSEVLNTPQAPPTMQARSSKCKITAGARVTVPPSTLNPGRDGEAPHVDVSYKVGIAAGSTSPSRRPASANAAAAARRRAYAATLSIASSGAVVQRQRSPSVPRPSSPLIGRVQTTHLRGRSGGGGTSVLVSSRLPSPQPGLGGSTDARFVRTINPNEVSSFPEPGAYRRRSQELIKGQAKVRPPLFAQILQGDRADMAPDKPENAEIGRLRATTRPATPSRLPLPAGRQRTPSRPRTPGAAKGNALTPPGSPRNARLFNVATAKHALGMGGTTVQSGPNVPSPAERNISPSNTFVVMSAIGVTTQQNTDVRASAIPERDNIVPSISTLWESTTHPTVAANASCTPETELAVRESDTSSASGSSHSNISTPPRRGRKVTENQDGGVQVGVGAKDRGRLDAVRTGARRTRPHPASPASHSVGQLGPLGPDPVPPPMPSSSPGSPPISAITVNSTPGPTPQISETTEGSEHSITGLISMAKSSTTGSMVVATNGGGTAGNAVIPAGKENGPGRQQQALASARRRMALALAVVAEATEREAMRATRNASSPETSEDGSPVTCPGESSDTSNPRDAVTTDANSTGDESNAEKLEIDPKPLREAIDIPEQHVSEEDKDAESTPELPSDSEHKLMARAAIQVRARSRVRLRSRSRSRDRARSRSQSHSSSIKVPRRRPTAQRPGPGPADRPGGGSPTAVVRPTTPAHEPAKDICTIENVGQQINKQLTGDSTSDSGKSQDLGASLSSSNESLESGNTGTGSETPLSNASGGESGEGEGHLATAPSGSAGDASTTPQSMRSSRQRMASTMYSGASAAAERAAEGRAVVLRNAQAIRLVQARARAARRAVRLSRGEETARALLTAQAARAARAAKAAHALKAVRAHAHAVHALRTPPSGEWSPRLWFFKDFPKTGLFIQRTAQRTRMAVLAICLTATIIVLAETPTRVPGTTITPGGDRATWRLLEDGVETRDGSAILLQRQLICTCPGVLSVRTPMPTFLRIMLLFVCALASGVGAIVGDERTLAHFAAPVAAFAAFEGACGIFDAALVFVVSLAVKSPRMAFELGMRSFATPLLLLYLSFPLLRKCHRTWAVQSRMPDLPGLEKSKIAREMDQKCAT